MKTSPTMVPVLLLLIAFGCFLAAPAVVAEGPWDGENTSGGNHPLHGSTTTVHNGGQNESDSGTAILRDDNDPHEGGFGLVDFFYRIAIRFVIDYFVVPETTTERTSASVPQAQSTSAAGAMMSRHAAK